jgi:hypothetical protein
LEEKCPSQDLKNTWLTDAGSSPCNLAGVLAKARAATGAARAAVEDNKQQQRKANSLFTASHKELAKVQSSKTKAKKVALEVSSLVMNVLKYKAMYMCGGCILPA